MKRRTTSLLFEPYEGRSFFPRWSVTYNVPGEGSVYRTFNFKMGARIFAWRLGRSPLFWRPA